MSESLKYYEEHEPKGEYVLVLEGLSREARKAGEIAAWEEMSVQEHMEYYEKQGIDHKDAMKKVAADRGVGKRDIYQALLDNKE